MQAVIALGEPFEIALPVVVGFIAGQWGVPAAIGCLAPLGILLLAPWRAKGPAKGTTKGLLFF